MADHRLIIPSTQFNQVVQKLRTFFLSKGFVETHTQNRLSILAACEDPTTVATYRYTNPTTGVEEIWPLPQTGQMWLEYELLNNPTVPGFFCVSTSYRNEKNPVEGRHMTIFPMFEFELQGDINKLAALEKELLEYLGYTSSHEIGYESASKLYRKSILDHADEEALCNDFGSSVMLCDFPNRTHPFWNMKQHEDGTAAHKIDVICSGQETIGSAERSCDPEMMRKMFDQISDGGYKQLLYDQFGEDRVEREMTEFLSHDFFPRSGGGIGISRLIRSMKLEGLLD